MAKQPANLIYGLNDRPSPLVTFFLALQHVSIVVISLLFPVLLVREIGGGPQESVRLVSASMLAAGVGVILQSLKKGPLGSGYLCPSVCGPSYLAASLLAAKTGGLALVFGMTTVAALFEGLFAKIMRHLRVLFPAEVTGLIVLMVGLTVVRIATINFFGLSDPSVPLSRTTISIAFLTLGIMIGLNVWSGGKLKLFCALIGMVLGYILAIVFGVFDVQDISRMATVPFFALPLVGHPGWAFEWSLLIPFLVAMICSSLKTVGDLTTCQRINDVEWKRPDMENVSKGLLADGFGALIAGLVGGFGQSSSSTNVGLSIATGATSRVIALWTGALLMVMSLFPYASMAFVEMPAPVLGATLLFALSFMVVAGMQIIMSRMMDGRKTFVVGLSIIFGLSVDIVPEVYSHVPTWLAPVVSSSLAAATILAVVLNLLFRLGIKETAVLRVAGESHVSDTVFAFMEKQGGHWGARQEVVQKATFAMCEVVEMIYSVTGEREAAVDFTVAFDEYNLDVTAQYSGAPLAPVTRPPSPDDLTDGDNCPAMSMFLIQQYCDKLHVEQGHNGVNVLKLHFVH